MRRDKNVLAVSTAVYPLEAIYAACYSFLDRAYFHLEEGAGGKVLVRMKEKKAPEKGAGGDLADEFLNELLHHALRRKVVQSNQKIREYIVTQALVSAQPGSETAPDRVEPMKKEAAAVLDKELEAEIEKLLAEVEKTDGGEDPLKIGVPWEEKFQKGKKKQGNKPDETDVQPEAVSPDGDRAGGQGV